MTVDFIPQANVYVNECIYFALHFQRQMCVVFQPLNDIYFMTPSNL